MSGGVGGVVYSLILLLYNAYMCIMLLPVFPCRHDKGEVL